MKKCNHCGATIANDNIRFCPECGMECGAATTINKSRSSDDKSEDASSLMGDKNVLSNSTVIGRQDKYEASNITINNTITEDHSLTTVVCAVSGKRVYMDNSVVCPKCGKSVSTEYYNEMSRRCDNCEREAVELFKSFATRLLSDSSLDNSAKATLDAKARELTIDEAKQRDILRSVQSASRSRDMVLSAVQQAELDSAVERLMRSSSEEECKSALGMFKALHDMSQNYTVEFWYYLSRAVAEPEAYIADYEEELTENYWQRYWGFLAYTITANSKSVAAIEHLRKSYGDREDDIRLAESAYFVARGFECSDSKMLTKANELRAAVNADYLSKPLIFIYNTLTRLTSEGLRLDVNYSLEEVFTILNILRAGRVIEGMRAEEQAAKLQAARAEAERARLERETQERAAKAEREAKERAERERREQEAARKAQEAALLAEHKNRMEQAKASVSGNKPQKEIKDKAFVGYENNPPKKKSSVGRIILIVLIVIVVLIGILFLIPAPESMQ